MQVHTNTCMSVFVAALFLRAPKWQQGRRLSLHKWTGKQITGYPHNGMLFSNKNANTGNNLGESQSHRTERKSQSQSTWTHWYPLPGIPAEVTQTLPVVTWGREWRAGLTTKCMRELSRVTKIYYISIQGDVCICTCVCMNLSNLFKMYKLIFKK